MAKSKLENAIQKAAAGFSKVIIDAVKAATLQELLALQEVKVVAPRAKAGRKPGRPAGQKKAKVKKVVSKPKAVVKAKTVKSAKKKRVVKNYPKCAYPGCSKNRFPRGKGFCGEHWRLSAAGKIKSAEAYAKK